MDERLFVPIFGRAPKRVLARPIRFIAADRQHAVLFRALARSPHAHNLEAVERSLAQSLWHRRAVFVLVHHSDIRADETERAAVGDPLPLHRVQRAYDGSQCPPGASLTHVIRHLGGY